jgi:hypothetical protein
MLQYQLPSDCENNNDTNLADNGSTSSPPNSNEYNDLDGDDHRTTNSKATTKAVAVPRDEKYCSLQYRIVTTYPRMHYNTGTTNNDTSSCADRTTLQLLQVTTQQGTRHMIRALLSCYHLPVCGDLRYDSSLTPLPDQSVALHAYSITMKKSILDKTKPRQKAIPDVDVVISESKENLTNQDDETTAQNNNGHSKVDINFPENPRDGSLYDTSQYCQWIAPLPPTWSIYFHCTQSMIDAWKNQFPL